MPSTDDALFAELRHGIESGASDWHYAAEQPVHLRIGGAMTAIEGPPVPADRVRAIAAALLQREKAPEHLDTCFGWAAHRFRFHSFSAAGEYCFALRRLPLELPELDAIGVPPAYVRVALRARRGLILVTGPTGSGKSTTLAATLHRLNEEREAAILTFEDPIEFRHPHLRAMVRQLELGRDFADLAAALQTALRADPDILVVGEIRDRATMAAALTAAETGHLVLATLHATSAAGAVARIAGAFPASHAAEIRSQLAEQLVAVLAQQLVRAPNGRAVAAFELMLATPGVRRLMLDPERRSALLLNEIATGRGDGMTTMDRSLEDLWRRGLLTRAEALRAAADPATLEPLLRRSA